MLAHSGSVTWSIILPEPLLYGLVLEHQHKHLENSVFKENGSYEYVAY